MKRPIYVLLTLTLALGLTACGGKDRDPSTPQPSQTAAPVATTIPVATAAPTGTISKGNALNLPPVTTPSPEASAEPDQLTPPSVNPLPEGGGTGGEAMAALAASLVGREFQMGGTGPDTFDNSGFVYYICRENGIQAPRRTSELAVFGQAVDWEHLRPGDICVMANEAGGEAGFVGIYAGDLSFLACNKPGDTVRLQSLDNSYWRDRFLCGRRVVGEE